MGVYQKNLKRISSLLIEKNSFDIKVFFLNSYANCSLNKYMDKHNIRSDTRAFQLLTRLLTIDPIKRLTGKKDFNKSNIFYDSFYLALDAMNDPYFKEDPRPTDE